MGASLLLEFYKSFCLKLDRLPFPRLLLDRLSHLSTAHTTHHARQKASLVSIPPPVCRSPCQAKTADTADSAYSASSASSASASWPPWHSYPEHLFRLASWYSRHGASFGVEEEREAAAPPLLRRVPSPCPRRPGGAPPPPWPALVVVQNEDGGVGLRAPKPNGVGFLMCCAGEVRAAKLAACVRRVWMWCFRGDFLREEGHGDGWRAAGM